MFLFGRRKSSSNAVVPVDAAGENTLLRSQLARLNIQLEIISEINDKILATRSLEEVLQYSIDAIVDKFGLLGAVLLLKRGKELTAKTIAGGAKAELFTRTIGKPISVLKIRISPESQNLVVQSVISKKLIYNRDLSGYTKEVLPDFLVSQAGKVIGINMNVSIPIVFDGEVIGAVVFATSKDSFEDRIASLQLLSKSIGISIVNSQSFAEKERLVGQLKLKVDELEEIARKERDMLDILAHELRTPMSTIRNYYDVFSKGIQPIPGKMDQERFDKYDSTIRDNIKREINLLEAILTSAVMDSHRVNLRVEQVDLAKVLAVVTDNFRPEAEKKGLQLLNLQENAADTVGLSDQAGAAQSTHVQGDPERIIQLVGNLVSNAIKYTQEGKISLSLRTADGVIGVSVEDSGEGIAPEDIPNLGKKFYRVNQHITGVKEGFKNFARPGGTGIGLYVAFELAKLMGGRVQVESELGKGSVFTLWLPLAAPIAV
jgi:signal transduction histidine kinase